MRYAQMCVVLFCFAYLQMRRSCDVIAQGIIEAAKTIKLSVPLVVRLEGALL